MAKIIEPAGKKTLKEKISLLLQKHRLILLGILGVVVAVLIGTAVVVSSANSRLEEGILKMEALQELYETEWIAAEDDEAKAVAEEKVLAEIDSLVVKYENSFPKQKALFIKGDLFSRKEEWKNAVEAYIQIADEFPESYLAPVALMHAATTAEEDGDLDSALTSFQRLTADYPENLEEVYRALFNIGRIQELQGNVELALDSYNELLDMGASNAWSSLAQTRVIVLEAE